MAQFGIKLCLSMSIGGNTASGKASLGFNRKMCKKQLSKAQKTTKQMSKNQYNDMASPSLIIAFVTHGALVVCLLFRKHAKKDAKWQKLNCFKFTR